MSHGGANLNCCPRTPFSGPLWAAEPTSFYYITALIWNWIWYLCPRVYQFWMTYTNQPVQILILFWRKKQAHSNNNIFSLFQISLGIWHVMVQPFWLKHHIQQKYILGMVLSTIVNEYFLSKRKLFNHLVLIWLRA